MCEMKRILFAVTRCLGEIEGDAYAKTYMQIKKIDRRLSLRNVSQKMVILDVGGGLGLDDLLFAHKGAYPVVVDLGCEDLKKGKRICKDLGLHDNFDHLVADARHLPFKNGSFDMVSSFSAIEHLPKRYEFKVWIREMARVLKNCGKFILTTSNRLWIMYPIAKLSFTLKRHSPEHFFTPEEIMDELKQYNIRIEAFDAGIVLYRRYFLIALPNELAEALENLLNQLDRFHCFKFLCGRMGVRGTKEETSTNNGCYVRLS